MQITCKFIDMLKIDHMLKIDCFARKNECTEALFALHTNNCLNGIIFNISQQLLQNINIDFVSKQPNTVDLFRSFDLAYQCMEMLNKR